MEGPDQATLTVEATKVYAELVSHGDISTVRSALHQADHRGWMRGFHRHKEIADSFRKTHEPMLFYMGWVLGFTLASILHINKVF
jgi:hypothetical protein